MVAAHAQRDDELVERRVARALADPVHGALDLVGAGLDGGERAGDGEPEVVVAVDGDRRRDDAPELGDERGELRRQRAPARVPDADGDRAGGERRAEDRRDGLRIGGGRVRDGDLNLVGAQHGRLDRPAHRVRLVRADGKVDPRAARAHERGGGGVEVVLQRPREHGDHRPAHGCGHGADADDLGRRPGLEHVDAEPLELERDVDPVLGKQDGAGRQPAVAQRGVENLDPARCHEHCPSV